MDDVIRLPGTEGQQPVVQPSAEPDLDVLLEHVEHRIGFACRFRLVADRGVECKAHGVRVEAYDVLAYYARDWGNYRAAFKRATAEVSLLERRVETLRRQERNAKARVRKAEDPAVREARLALAGAASAFHGTYDALHALGVRPDGDFVGRLSAAAYRCRLAAERLDPARSDERVS